jgi:hypothetical protein
MEGVGAGAGSAVAEPITLNSEVKQYPEGALKILNLR